MSQERKNLKITSLVLIALGLVVCGAMFGCQAAGITHYPQNFLVLMGALSVIAIAAGWLGVKGANVPSKAKPCYILSFLLVLASVATIFPALNPVSTLDGKVGVLFALFGSSAAGISKLVYEQSLDKA